jgi:hypothetical protein
MSDENKQEKLSFWQLLETTSVEIPIIQRDYAQGRATKEKVRNDFLDAIYNALTTDVPVELDFVYGSEEKNILQPLDGQQRLTTLFLLHWFIANKEGQLESAKERLSKFTYETRPSSQEFCKELVGKSIKYDDLLPVDEEKEITVENQLSKTIKNAGWFVMSWEKDPTISAMLIMLDAIQSKFKDSSGLWEKLIETEDEKRPITFLYIELKDFGLSDDLYIKMNARGKQLTPFENFKSRFIKHIEVNKWEEGITNPQEKFAHKIDTDWTDLFWKYRGNDNLIDNEMINFIAGIAINYYAQSLDILSNKDNEAKVRKELEEKGKKTISDDAVKRERVERRMKALFNNPNEINPKDFSTKESFEYLKCLDTYYQNDYAELKPEVKLWKYRKDTLFKDIIQNEKTEWQNRAVFYAQTEYLLRTPHNKEKENSFDFDKYKYNDWMRVVRNIVENSTIDDATPFIAAITLIQELSAGCSNIYEYLSTNKVTAGHAREQIKEEIEKAKIIVAQPDAKKVVHDTEDTNFCKGKIDFALYCSDYDIENPNPSVFDKDKLEKICKVINDHLSKEDVSNDFRRAFFTIQNNDFYDYWKGSMWSWQFHRRCLLENTNDFKHHFALRGKNDANISNNNWSYSKELLDKLSTTTIETIIEEFKSNPNFNNIPLWIQTIINKPKLLDCSGYHYMVYTNAGKYYMVTGWRTAVQKSNWDGLKEIK